MAQLSTRARVHGTDSLSDAELVSLVLGVEHASTVARVAVLLEEAGGLPSLLRRGVGALERDGLRRGARLAAAMELARRVAACVADEGMDISDSAAVAEWARARLAHLDHEELWMLAVDGQRRLRAARCVAKGGLHGLQLHVRDPLRVALREGASAIVLVHNHPSGDPTPSSQDVEFTVRIAAACELVATPLLDHVVVARARHASLLALGLLEATPPARASPQKRAS